MEGHSFGWDGIFSRDAEAHGKRGVGSTGSRSPRGGDPLCMAKQAEPSQQAGSGGGARVGTKEPDFPR